MQSMGRCDLKQFVSFIDNTKRGRPFEEGRNEESKTAEEEDPRKRQEMGEHGECVWNTKWPLLLGHNLWREDLLWCLRSNGNRCTSKLWG